MRADPDHVENLACAADGGDDRPFGHGRRGRNGPLRRRLERGGAYGKGQLQSDLPVSNLIEEGRARYGGTGGVAISGSVGANGAVRGSIGTSGASVNVAGRLSGVSGGGTWT